MEKIIREFLKESNAIEEVFDEESLSQALHAWNYLVSNEKLTPGVILKTHKILMLHQPLFPNEKGYFRTIPVWVGYKEVLQYPYIKEHIDIWCKNANNNPVEWKEHHIEYENIHPFVDGNGRTGRMFMNWERLKAGLPILVIKNAEKGKYYGWFKQ